MKWKTFEDELPTEGERVLIHKIPEGSAWDSSKAYYFFAYWWRRKWRGGFSEGYLPFVNENVTHWMPFPEPPQDEKMKWISVKEELPHNLGLDDQTEDHVYLISNGKQISIGTFEPEYFAECPEEPCQYDSGGWWDQGRELTGDPFSEVTHWMPLPEPPEEE